MKLNIIFLGFTLYLTFEENSITCKLHTLHDATTMSPCGGAFA